MDLFALSSTGGSALIEALLLLFVVSIAAGVLGAMLGLGGGIILVPALVLLFDVNIHLAIATSLVSVVATSIGSASTAVSSGLTDLRLGMFLETATAVGGLAGALIAVTVLASQDEILILAFVPVVILGVYLILSQRPVEQRAPAAPDPLARRLKLEGDFVDPETGAARHYEATRTTTGLAFSGLAGVAGGLLGIGGGVFYVPAMNGPMHIPMRVASATSVFMIGVTAAGGAFVYLYAGYVSLLLTAPVVLGALAGSIIGIRLQPRAKTSFLKQLFAGVVVLAAVLMALRGLGVY